MTDVTATELTATPQPIQGIKITRARRRFEPGMIVLDPRPGEPGALVWTVASTTSRSTTLLADYGAEQAEAVLTGPEHAFIPDGWRVLEHDKIASVFAGDGQHADVDLEEPLPVEAPQPVMREHIGVQAPPSLVEPGMKAGA